VLCGGLSAGVIFAARAEMRLLENLISIEALLGDVERF
jgi:hypothetical protein